MLRGKTLTQNQINEIKDVVAACSGKFPFDITDEEVWGYVSAKQDAMNIGLYNKELRYKTWFDALEYCMDDFGCAEALAWSK